VIGAGFPYRCVVQVDWSVLVRGWRVVPERRRQGQRVALVVEAIHRLSGGCCAVAVFPGMGEYPEDCEQVTEAYRLQTKEEITALWESIGFQLFRRGVWLLDTALRRPENSCRSAALNCARSARPYSRPSPSESGSAGTTADADGTGSCRGGRVRSGFSCGRWSGSGKP
jgi:hypothetical protein